MATINTRPQRSVAPTHEGAPGIAFKPTQTLDRLVQCAMLWEDSFYVDGQSAAEAIVAAVKEVPPAEAGRIALVARNSGTRHAPLLVLSALMQLGHSGIAASAIRSMNLRPDDLTELVAMWWKDKKRRIPHAIQRAINAKMIGFSRYQLAKYATEKGAVRLRDLIFLCHTKPTEELAWTFKEIADDTIKQENTWESLVSAAGANKDAKRDAFAGLLAENKLGGLALLRNLRNMLGCGINRALLADNIDRHPFPMVWPFRFLAAHRACGDAVLSASLEKAMIRRAGELTKLSGSVVVLVDISPSMVAPLSGKSDMNRIDAACALAAVVREMANDVRLFSFSNGVAEIRPSLRGLGIIDALPKSQPSNGTMLGAAVKSVPACDTLIVITDEQSRDAVGAPNARRGFMVNVADYKNGVGFGDWTRINGWSDGVAEFIARQSA